MSPTKNVPDDPSVTLTPLVAEEYVPVCVAETPSVPEPVSFVIFTTTLDGVAVGYPFESTDETVNSTLLPTVVATPSLNDVFPLVGVTTRATGDPTITASVVAVPAVMPAEVAVNDIVPVSPWILVNVNDAGVPLA